MAGQIYNVFLGGDALKYPWENWLDNSVSDPSQWTTYASHLKRTHFTVPFHFDRFSDVWNKWFEESGKTDLEVGEGLGVNLLAAGSLVRELVVHVKKPLPGTKVKVQLLGTVGDKPTDLNTLAKAIETAKANYEKAVAALNADPENATKKTAVATAKTAYDKAEEALDAATAKMFDEYEIDFAQAGFYRFPINKMLQSNGKVDVVLTAGTFENACFSVMTEVNNFDDQHGCSCGFVPCDTPYPDAMCQPNV